MKEPQKVEPILSDDGFYDDFYTDNIRGRKRRYGQIIMGIVAIVLVAILLGKVVLSQQQYQEKEPPKMIQRIQIVTPDIPDPVPEIVTIDDSDINMPIQDPVFENEFVYYPNISLSKDLQYYTWTVADEFDIRYTLLLSLMYRESGFIQDIVGYNKNGTTDSGLMQINSCAEPFMEQIGVTDFLCPEDNIFGGSYLLRYHLDNNNNDEVAALMAYQFGQGGANVQRRKGITTSSEIEKLYYIENYLLENDTMPTYIP